MSHFCHIPDKMDSVHIYMLQFTPRDSRDETNVKVCLYVTFFIPCPLLAPLKFSIVPIALADPRGRQGCASRGSKFFHFHAVFGKNLKKIIPLWELAPPQENPGSATEN